MSQAPSDVEILEKFAQPALKRHAFQLLMDKYQRKIYSVIRKMVVSHEDADDLTQEVFIKVWSRLDGFQRHSQLFTWLYRIAVNECLSFLRRKRTRFFLPIEDISAELSHKLDSSPYISGEEIDFKLQKALLTLPDKQRLVFNMKYYEELSYEEMSAVLGTSVGALKASYHHAVKKIESFVRTG